MPNYAGGLEADESIVVPEQGSTPATPASGKHKIYTKTDDQLYIINDAGTEFNVSGDGNVTVSTKGDLQTYSTVAANLAVGTNGQKLIADSAQTTGLDWVDDHGYQNMIIDPQFLHFPEGDKTGWASSSYCPAMWDWFNSGTAVIDGSQDTDVPSGSKVKYSLKIDVTAADTALATNEVAFLRYYITGYDLAVIWGQTVVFSFWVKAVKTGTYGVSMINAGNARSYVQTITINSASTWEQKSVTFDLTEPTGIWNYDANVGAQLTICLDAGTDFETTAGAWQSSQEYTTSAQATGLDHTDNNFWIHAPQLHVGTVAQPFVAPSAAETQRKVEWYVERLDFDALSNEMTGFSGHHANVNTSTNISIHYSQKRAVPSSITSSSNDTFRVQYSNTSTPGTGGGTFSSIGKRGALYSITHAAAGSAGDGVQLMRDTTDTCWIMIDARH